MKKRNYIIGFILLVLFSCTPADVKTTGGTQTIKIGAVTLSDLYSEEGIRLAVKEINNAGGLLGKTLEVDYRHDNASLLEGKLIAQDFCEEPEIVAVIGHESSDVAIPVSSLYEFNRKLYISPSATAAGLTESGLRYVFRNIMSDAELARSLVISLALHGYTNIMIVSASNDYGRFLSNNIEFAAQKEGVNVIDRVTYSDGESSFSGVFDYWKNISFDAVLISGSLPESGYIIKEIRKQRISVPIIGSNIKFSSIKDYDPDVEGVIAISYFNPDDSRPEVQDFVNAFVREYGVLPDEWAAQGYDAVNLFAYAVENSGSVDIEELRKAILDINQWKGVTGTHTFSESGDVIGKRINFVVYQDNNFKHIDW